MNPNERKMMDDEEICCRESERRRCSGGGSALLLVVLPVFFIGMVFAAIANASNQGPEFLTRLLMSIGIPGLFGYIKGLLGASRAKRSAS